MPPPELARDAPVFDVAHPVRICLRPALRKKFDFALFHGCSGTFDLRIFKKPLLAEIRFDGDIAALAITHIVHVVLDLQQVVLLLKLLHHCFARYETIETGKSLTRFFGHYPIGPDHNRERQIVTHRHFIIGLVMRRSDLNATGAEFRIHQLVGDDGNLFVT